MAKGQVNDSKKIFVGLFFVLVLIGIVVIGASLFSESDGAIAGQAINYNSEGEVYEISGSDSCGAELDIEGATYVISADLDCTSVVDSPGLNVIADEIELYCEEGVTIIGPSEGDYAGILLSEGKDVEIYGCNIEGFKNGLYLDTDFESVGVYYGSVSNSDAEGIYIDSFSESYFESVLISNAGAQGIYLSENTEGVIFVDISISGSSAEAINIASEGNILNNIHISDDNGYGIMVSASNNELNNVVSCGLDLGCHSGLTGLLGSGNYFSNVGVDCDSGWPKLNTNYYLCEDVEVSCDDGGDNDLDGAFDSEDSDCICDDGTIKQYYEDSDGDGYGEYSSGPVCSSDLSNPVEDGTDCNDLDEEINPGEAEIISDGIDQDCSGVELVWSDLSSQDECSTFNGQWDSETSSCSPVSDGANCENPSTWYTDFDGDGYTSGGSEVCSQPENTIDYSLGEDCDDNDGGVQGENTWYTDGDGDGFTSGSLEACQQPENTIASSKGEDCDDGNSGESEASYYTDEDSDGYGDSDSGVLYCSDSSDVNNPTMTGGDCNDNDADQSPGLQEICSDGKDNNCDGSIDEADDCLDLSGVDISEIDEDEFNEEMLMNLGVEVTSGSPYEGYDLNDDGYLTLEDIKEYIRAKLGGSS